MCDRELPTPLAGSKKFISFHIALAQLSPKTQPPDHHRPSPTPPLPPNHNQTESHTNQNHTQVSGKRNSTRAYSSFSFSNRNTITASAGMLLVGHDPQVDQQHGDDHHGQLARPPLQHGVAHLGARAHGHHGLRRPHPRAAPVLAGGAAASVVHAGSHAAIAAEVHVVHAAADADVDAPRRGEAVRAQGLPEGQRLNHGVRQVLNEDGVGVQRRHAAPLLAPALLRQLTVLHVHLLQRLDVLGHKGHRHRHQTLALGAQLADGVVRVRLQPLHGPHAALVRQHVLVVHADARQLRHDERHALLHLLLVRVPRGLHVRHRHPVRAEEDHRLVRRVERPRRVVQLPLDQLRHGERVARALVPAGDHRVHHVSQVLVFREELLQQAQARAASGDGELRVQGQHHEARDAVRLDLCHGVLREGLPVAHAHVHLGLLALAPQRQAQRLALLVRDAAQRGAAPDALVRRHALGRAAVGQHRGQRALQEAYRRGQPDDVGVREQVVQEGLHVLQLLGPAQVQQQDPHALLVDAAGAGGEVVDGAHGGGRQHGAGCGEIEVVCSGGGAATAGGGAGTGGRSGGRSHGHASPLPLLLLGRAAQARDAAAANATHAASPPAAAAAAVRGGHAIARCRARDPSGGGAAGGVAGGVPTAAPRRRRAHGAARSVGLHRRPHSCRCHAQQHSQAPLSPPHLLLLSRFSSLQRATTLSFFFIISCFLQLPK
mmetsp:Transcript_26331/g.64665  ORF Transcript_26331/g.64665 Transcript_26331/m.64665 type:complete len:716 (+) Transcript_26331:83-2230(+)